MYRKLEIWKDSVELIKMVYEIAEEFPKSEEYNLKSQLKRAITSVTLNIVEGKCRSTSKDFAHFLNMASSSLSESEAILGICVALSYIKEDNNVIEKIVYLNKRINALRIKLLKEDAND